LRDVISAAMMPNIRNPTIALVVNGRLVGRASLQVVETDKTHIRRFWRIADFWGLRGDRGARENRYRRGGKTTNHRTKINVGSRQKHHRLLPMLMSLSKRLSRARRITIEGCECLLCFD